MSNGDIEGTFTETSYGRCEGQGNNRFPTMTENIDSYFL